MSFDGMMLGVYHLPKIEVDSGTDWVTLLGFLLTVIAVAAGSMVTICTFKRTVKSQESLARKLALKESRQQWINELRDACAEYIAVIMVLRSQAMNLQDRLPDIYDLRTKDSSAAADLIHSINSLLQERRREAFALKAKIVLLSNPTEEPFKRLMGLALTCIEMAEGNGDVVACCDELALQAQEILKKEWDRTKALGD